MQICSSTGPTVDPDKRDLDQRSPSTPDVATFIQKHFKGIDLVPSIVEHCLYTVSYSSIKRHFFCAIKFFLCFLCCIGTDGWLSA